MKKIIIKFIISLLALYLTDFFLEGIKITDFSSAILAILILALFNTFLRPILKLLTLPLNILTLGLFSFVINALLLLLTAHFVSGFVVAGFIPALIGAVLLSLISSILGYFLK